MAAELERLLTSDPALDELELETTLAELETEFTDETTWLLLSELRLKEVLETFEEDTLLVTDETPEAVLDTTTDEAALKVPPVLVELLSPSGLLAQPVRKAKATKMRSTAIESKRLTFQFIIKTSQFYSVIV